MTSSAPHHHDGSSASSTPRAGNGNGNGNHHHHPPPLPLSPQAQAHGGPNVRLMCSFGGRIMPRPGDHLLRYVGGETRILSVPRTASYAALVAALAKLAPALFAPGSPAPALRYQLPQDDLDALISISSDDDVDNLMDELDRLHCLTATAIKPPRLRLFLFAPSPDRSSAAGGFGSVLSGVGDASSDQWFVDALNAPAPPSIERGRSEASSIVSEVPDYLFGLDTTSEEPSPGTAATRPKSDAEAPHGEDDAPAPVAPIPYVAEGAPWPAPPPPYMPQMVYYVPVRPFHYVDSAGQGSYVPGPVYHILGGGGSEATAEPLYASGSLSGVYGVPNNMQPYRQMMYAPPSSAVYSAEGKTPEGGASAS